MTYRNGNYCAFYVDEPFVSNNLGAFFTPDFSYYMLLCTWKGLDRRFPFIDSHGKTYNVRDGSDWERTLKPRLHERLKNSKNIVLFLSSITRNSRALYEELKYGVFDQKLPMIIIYPDFKSYGEMVVSNRFNQSVQSLWGKLPNLNDVFKTVPVVHVPLKQEFIRAALENKNYCVGSKINLGNYIV